MEYKYTLVEDRETLTRYVVETKDIDHTKHELCAQADTITACADCSFLLKPIRPKTL